MEQIPLIIQTFLSYKETIQGRSPLTVKEYYLDLRTFFRFLLVSRGEVLISKNDADEFSAFSLAIGRFFRRSYFRACSKKVRFYP